MASPELADGKHTLEQKSEHSLAKAEAHKAFTQERAELSKSIDTSLLDLPEHAQIFLKENCTTPHHLSLAVHEVTLLLQSDPTVLDDPAFAEFELDACIEKTEIAAKTEELEKIDATAETLSNIKADYANLKGMAYLEAAKAHITANKEKLASAQQKELLVHFSEIETMAGEIFALAETSKEQAEIQRLFTSSSINLTANNMADTFSSFVEQAETSRELSEDSKDRIAAKLGITRLPEPKTGGQVLSKLDNIRINNGHFINAEGNVVDFNDKNGMKVGEFTVYPHSNDTHEYKAIANVGGRELRLLFSPDTSPDFLTRQLRAAMVGYALANKDFQAAAKDVLGGSYLVAQGVSEIKLASKNEVQRAERVLEACLGTGSVYAGRLPTPQDMELLEWRLQATHVDGDAKTNDNTKRGDESWEQLGLVTPDGRIDYGRLSKIGKDIRTAPTLPSYVFLLERYGIKNKVVTN